MDKQTTLKIIQRESVMIWDALAELYPKLLKFDVPVVTLNSRFWRTAGTCNQESNEIELGYKFFTKAYTPNMIDVILPHEIIHQADYNLFGLCATKQGHGEKWCEIMIKYGLPALRYHDMDIKRK